MTKEELSSGQGDDSKEIKGQNFEVEIVGKQYYLSDDGDHIGETILASDDNIAKSDRDKGIGILIPPSILRFIDRNRVIDTIGGVTYIRVRALIEIEKGKSSVLDLFLLRARQGEAEVSLPRSAKGVTADSPEDLGIQFASVAREGTGDDQGSSTPDAAEAAEKQLEYAMTDAAKAVEAGGNLEKPPVSPQMENALLHLLEDRGDREQREKDPYAGTGEKKSGIRGMFWRKVLGRADDTVEVSPQRKKKKSLGPHWATALMGVRDKVVGKLGEDSDDARTSAIITTVGLHHKDMQIGAAVMEFLTQVLIEPESRNSMFFSSRVSVRDLKLAKLWMREYLGMSPPEEETGGGTSSFTFDRVMRKIDSDVPAIRELGIKQLPIVASQELRACEIGGNFNEERAIELFATFQKASMLAEFNRLNQGDGQQFVEGRRRVARTIAKRTGQLPAGYGAVADDPSVERRRDKLKGGR